MRWNLSTIPLVDGLYGVVRILATPSQEHRFLKMTPSNSGPLSESSSIGGPKMLNTRSNNVSATVAAL